MVRLNFSFFHTVSHCNQTIIFRENIKETLMVSAYDTAIRHSRERYRNEFTSAPNNTKRVQDVGMKSRGHFVVVVIGRFKIGDLFRIWVDQLLVKVYINKSRSKWQNFARQCRIQNTTGCTI